MVKFSLLRLIFWISIFLFQGGNGTLKTIQILMRHGDREPDNGSIANGSLTKEGKRQMFNLGRYMRNQYPTIAQDKFDCREAVFISSDVERVINSGSLFGRGFYHKYNYKSQWNVNNGLKYEPITIKSIPVLIDKYITSSHPCPRYEIQDEVTKTKFLNAFVSRHEKILRIMARETGNSIIFDESQRAYDRGAPMSELLNSIRKSLSHNQTVQDWEMNLATNEDIQRYSYDFFKLGVSTPEKQLFINGPFIQMLVENFENQNPKVAFYFGHDTNMFTLMQTLGIWDDHDYLLPPTGSALIFELHEALLENKINFYMELWYRNGTANPPRQRNIPNCSSPCTLQKFRENFKNVITVDYEAQCQLN